MRKYLLGTVVAVMGLLLAAPAFAGTIGPGYGPCGTCQGATYTLTYSYEAGKVGVMIGGQNSDVVDVTLIVNTAGYTGGGSLLNSVAVKVSSSLVGSTGLGNPYNYLISAPGGVGNWKVDAGGLNAGGCNGAGSGFDCAIASSLGHAPHVPTNTLLIWVFHLTIPHGTLMLGTNCLNSGKSDNNCATVKAQYTDSSGNKVGSLVSQDIALTPTPVPEPGAMLMFGSGMLALAGVVRRRLF